MSQPQLINRPAFLRLRQRWTSMCRLTLPTSCCISSLPPLPNQTHKKVTLRQDCCATLEVLGWWFPEGVLVIISGVWGPAAKAWGVAGGWNRDKDWRLKASLVLKALQRSGLKPLSLGFYWRALLISEAKTRVNPATFPPLNILSSRLWRGKVSTGNINKQRM